MLTETLVPISDLKPDVKNPNEMNHKQRQQLTASLTKYGFMQPLVIDHEHNIVNGNQKYYCILNNADLKRTFPKLPCYILPKNITSQDKLLIQQALNKIRGDHIRARDAEIFQSLLDENRTADLTELLGCNEDSIDLLIKVGTEVPEPVEIPFDPTAPAVQPPAVPAVPETKPADNNSTEKPLICPHCGKAI